MKLTKDILTQKEIEVFGKVCYQYKHKVYIDCSECKKVNYHIYFTCHVFAERSTDIELVDLITKNIL